MFPTGNPPDPQGFFVRRDIDPPRLVRFDLETRGTCYGQVVKQEDGVPLEVLLLPKVDGFDPCSEPPEPKEAAAHLGRALSILGDLDNPPSQPIKDIEVITDKNSASFLP